MYYYLINFLGVPQTSVKKNPKLSINYTVCCHTAVTVQFSRDACHDVLWVGPAVCCRSWRRRVQCSMSRWRRLVVVLMGLCTRHEIKTAGSLWLWRVWECRPIRMAFPCPRCERWRCSNDSSSSTIPTSLGTETQTHTHVRWPTSAGSSFKHSFTHLGFCIKFYNGFSQITVMLIFQKQLTTVI